jgi:phage I-like protein
VHRGHDHVHIYLNDPVDDSHLGYLVDMGDVQLDEKTGQSWIQALPLGKWKHPIHGIIDVTAERIKRFADNVKSNVRGQDLDIDYDHKERDTKAAGWVRDADARSDGLWLLVEWTKPAFKALKEREYRYFSPEFVTTWTHPSTGKQYQDVLFGGGLTNRPFLKGILPINLSEVFEGGNAHMDPKLRAALIKRLGLTDAATDEEILAAAEQEPEEPEGEQEEQEEEEEQESTQSVAASESLVKLAETNPEVKALLDERQADRQRLERLEVSTRLSEVNVTLGELSQGDNALPVALHEDVKKVLTEVPVQHAEKFAEVLKKIHKTGLVKLGEQGSSETKPGGDGQATKRFNEEVKKLTEGEGALGYADAVERIAASDPELFEAYREESFETEEVN